MAAVPLRGGRSPFFSAGIICCGACGSTAAWRRKDGRRRSSSGSPESRTNFAAPNGFTFPTGPNRQMLSRNGLVRSFPLRSRCRSNRTRLRAVAWSGLTGVARSASSQVDERTLGGIHARINRAARSHRAANGFHALGVRDDPMRRSSPDRRELRLTRASVGPGRLPSRCHVGRHQAGAARPATARRPRHSPRVDEEKLQVQPRRLDPRPNRSVGQLTDCRDADVL